MSAPRIALLLLLVFALQVSGVAMVCAPHPCCMTAIEADCGDMQMDVAACPMCDQVAKASLPTAAMEPLGKLGVPRIEPVPLGMVGVASVTSFSPTSVAAHRAPLTTVLRI